MKYRRNYFIHYYECDVKRRALLTTLMKYFEDIAILQSESRGVGLDYYENNNVAWVLYKWDIQIFKYPKFMDEIRVITEPIGFVRFYAYRSFEVRNQSDELLITANSMWFFVDTKSRRPRKITEDVIKGYQCSEEFIEPIIEDSRLPERFDHQKEFFVRQGDIDTNNHVNNIKYVEWALEAVPLDLQTEFHMKRLKITYKKETHYGKKIKSLVEICNEGETMICKHKIMEGDDDICFLESEWEKD